jgi:hypothetical protein
MLLYFAFYEQCRLHIISFIGYLLSWLLLFVHVLWVWCMFSGVLFSLPCAAYSHWLVYI